MIKQECFITTWEENQTWRLWNEYQIFVGWTWTWNWSHIFCYRKWLVICENCMHAMSSKFSIYGCQENYLFQKCDTSCKIMNQFDVHSCHRAHFTFILADKIKLHHGFCLLLRLFIPLYWVHWGKDNNIPSISEASISNPG